MPKFSITIPLYNKAPYIGKTINSILNQTYDDYEIVVCDDGSTDNGVELIRKNYPSEKIKIIQKQNGGPSSARNKAIKEAMGEWVLLLDADDMLMPYALERFCREIQLHPDANYIVGNFYNMMSKDDIKLGSQIKVNRKYNNGFYAEAMRILSETSGTAIFKRNILLEEPFDENLRRYEDAERQYRLMRKYPIYMFSTPVSIVNRESAAASNPRKNPEEDFVCHLMFKGKGFWEKLTLYHLVKDCKTNYPQKYNELYKDIESKWTLQIGFLYFRIYNKIFAGLNKYIFKKKRYNLNYLLSLNHEVDR